MWSLRVALIASLLDIIIRPSLLWGARTLFKQKAHECVSAAEKLQCFFRPFSGFFFWGRNCQIMKTSETYYKFYVFRQESKAANHTIKSINVLNVFTQPENLLISAFFFLTITNLHNQILF